jgi:pimeloyl-ACP methyl ester carboxylesterase
VRHSRFGKASVILIAVGEAAGFYDADREGALPVIIGHSLGSFFSERAVQLRPEVFKGLIIADGGVPHPVVWSGLSADAPPPWMRPAGTTHRVYAPTTTPDARLRLSPPQVIRHQYVVDHIASTSIKQAPYAPAGHWHWAVEPDHSSKVDSFIMLAHTVGTPAVVRALQQAVHVAVRYSFVNRILQPPLCHLCDQWHACRMSTLLTVRVPPCIVPNH